MGLTNIFTPSNNENDLSATELYMRYKNTTKQQQSSLSSTNVCEVWSNTQVCDKPRVLFLAYYFPPVNAIACVRTWNMAKYLARQGWHVTVITPQPSLWKHVEHPDAVVEAMQREGILRLPTAHQWSCLSPGYLHTKQKGLGGLSGGICRTFARFFCIEREIGWLKQAQKTCAALRAEDVDVILATGSPFISFQLAKRLSVKLGRPYVLDYRDLWTGNLHASRPSCSTTIQQEAILLEESAGVTTVSPSWGTILKQQFGIGAKLHMISNGYDPEELGNVRAYNFGHFAIVYTGNFYPPKRVITPFMAALKRLTHMLIPGTEWAFHYYGADESHVRQEAERFDLMDRVVFHGKTSRHHALSAVRGAGVSVVITSVATEARHVDNGMVTGKVFEGIGLRTPVLLIAPPGSDARAVVSETGLGESFLATDTEGIAAFLIRLIHNASLVPKSVDKYAWPQTIQRLDTILRQIIQLRNTYKS
jgi:glycosyltransferase involved in cell wall biosynthesis